MPAAATHLLHTKEEDITHLVAAQVIPVHMALEAGVNRPATMPQGVASAIMMSVTERGPGRHGAVISKAWAL